MNAISTIAKANGFSVVPLLQAFHIRLIQTWLKRAKLCGMQLKVDLDVQ